jgi:hypothetical protein
VIPFPFKSTCTPTLATPAFPRFSALLRSRLHPLCLVASLLTGITLPAQTSQTAPQSAADAAALVRRAVQHRADAEKTHQPLRYQLRKVDDRRDTTKEIVETRDGDVARLIALNGKPLTPDAEQAERARLDNLAAHPDLQERRHRTEIKDAARVSHLMALLPDALVYQPQGTVPCGSGECFRLSFSPRPGWNPPDLEADLLRGVAGEVWIDTRQERLVRLSGSFIADVDFGFGVLARLNQGGTFTLEQTEVAAHDWELTRLTLHITGKALMLKSISTSLTQEASHFAPVSPSLTYRDAIRMLEAETP